MSELLRAAREALGYVEDSWLPGGAGSRRDRITCELRAAIEAEEARLAELRRELEPAK